MKSSIAKRMWGFYRCRPWRVFAIPLLPIITILSSVRRQVLLKHPVKSVRRILITHFGAVGDVLMATPAMRLLNQRFSEAAITVVTSNRNAWEALRRNPRFKKVVFLQQYEHGNIKYRFARKGILWGDRIKLYFLYPFFVLWVLWKRFDMGISLGPFHEAGTFSNLLFLTAGIPVRVGCFGYHRSYLTHQAERKILSQHWIDVYFGIVGTVTANLDSKSQVKMEYQVLPVEESKVEGFLKSMGLAGGDNLVVIHPGGNTRINSKRWGPQSFAQVADALVEKCGAKVLITGSSDEISVAEEVVNSMKCPSVVVAGKFTIGEVAALLKRVSLCITNDTCILHLAEIMGTKKIVSIWGPTDPKKIAPRNERHHIVSSPLECSPCIDLDAGDKSKRCWRTIKEECLQVISVEDVLKIVCDQRHRV